MPGGGAQVLLGLGPCHAQAGKLDSIVLEGLSFLENFFQPVSIVSLSVQTHKVCYALTPHVLERVKDFCGDLAFIDDDERSSKRSTPEAMSETESHGLNGNCG